MNKIKQIEDVVLNLLCYYHNTIPIGALNKEPFFNIWVSIDEYKESGNIRRAVQAAILKEI